MKNPESAPENGTTIDGAAVSRNPEAAPSSVPVAKTSYFTGKWLSWKKCIYKGAEQNAPLQPVETFEESFEKEVNEIDSFKNSFNKLTEMITCFNDDNKKSNKKPIRCKWYLQNYIHLNFCYYGHNIQFFHNLCYMSWFDSDTKINEQYVEYQLVIK